MRALPAKGSVNRAVLFSADKRLHSLCPRLSQGAETGQGRRRGCFAALTRAGV